LALGLVGEVHRVLGAHRPDDERAGRLSGLDEEEGARHPTVGGLRIGKPLPERPPEDPVEDQAEWDRDGQYYHYLTKWMHALSRVTRVTGDPKYVGWARELAKTAHARFVAPLPGGRKRMFWKMSIDLSRPLVSAMGQHDPLDGFLTYCELQAAAAGFDAGSAGPDLADEIADLGDICRGEKWVTDDPLGIGGLLFDAGRVAQLTALGAAEPKHLLGGLLDAAHTGLASWIRSDPLGAPAGDRLPFRELGLSIGWKAVAQWGTSMGKRAEALLWYATSVDRIERFWTEEESRKAGTWMAHQDINDVMLATSLAPDAFLSV
ncbi:MAG: hypothetical protein HY900_28930, partial [Deltaproteobacteria bacterium]|nr:hypothetical protein [Deltaproteobacteria bacterium]